jgi:hypothetical protein
MPHLLMHNTCIPRIPLFCFEVKMPLLEVDDVVEAIVSHGQVRQCVKELLTSTFELCPCFGVQILLEVVRCFCDGRRSLDPRRERVVGVELVVDRKCLLLIETCFYLPSLVCVDIEYEKEQWVNRENASITRNPSVLHVESSATSTSTL